MKTVFTLGIILMASSVYADCNPVTYRGCTGTELRAIQSMQYAGRNTPVDPYINQRQQAQQRADREAALARQEREDARRLEAKVRVEEAKQYSKQDVNIFVPPIHYKNRVYTNKVSMHSAIRRQAPKSSTNTGSRSFYYNEFGKKIYGKPNVWR